MLVTKQLEKHLYFVLLIHEQPRNPSEEKTPGIAAEERIETHTWSPLKSDIRLNVWDFGGQEMMRGTHRFFLTSRSLYLLVLEDRREDDRSIYNWLKIIKNRGANSPILIVINKSDEGKEDLRFDERTLQEQHPEIVGFVRTSCNDTDWARKSIQKLREYIINIIATDERLKHVQDVLPESWLRIKYRVDKLAQEKKELRLRKYESICEEGAEPIDDENEQRILLRLLHDLGVVVAHGLEQGASASMREITLLDPNWLTEAIYTVLNHPTLRNQSGEFDRSQLKSWLDSKTYPEHRHEFILSMMQDDGVSLCFPLSKTR